MYRTIETSIWHDAKFRALPAPGKLLFVYLFSNPHAHVSGIYYLPDVMVTHETGLKQEAIDTLWHTLSSAGLASRDSTNEVVWVRNMLKHQGRGEKLRFSAANHLLTLHNSELVKEFRSYYPDVSKEAKRRGIDKVSGAGRVSLKEQEKDKDIPPTPADAGELPGFSQWWSEWPPHPRKDGKGKCLRKWQRSKLESKATEIIASLRFCKRSEGWTKQGGQFIPKPFTWLNDAPWETDPKELVPSANGHAVIAKQKVREDQ